jgi:hypothetical protein
VTFTLLKSVEKAQDSKVEEASKTTPIQERKKGGKERACLAFLKSALAESSSEG